MPGTQRFGFSCAPGARKARNLAANDQVVFAVDDTAGACRSRAAPTSSRASA
ncbi:MAG: hypothetical protein R2695_06860 [Acidimicrobiales bacterium]